MRLLGAHMSTAGGVDKAIERGQSIGCTAIQIFVKNNNQWFGKPLEKEEIERFIQLQKDTSIFVFAHAGYLINLASPDSGTHSKSMKSMLDELKRCEALKLPYLVLHPGSHMQQGEEAGLKKIVKSLDTLFRSTKDSKVKVLLETMAGQGTNLAFKFEQIRSMLDMSAFPKRLGVCFDTCHSYAAGYDIKSKDGYKKTWEEFDKVIGLKKLMAFHLNDSKQDFASRRDRHEHIGKGTLGKESFRMLLNDKRFKDLPMVLETPKDPEMKFDRINLRALRALVVNNKWK